MLFTVVVRCTTIPHHTVEAKDSFVRRAEVAQQEHEQSSTFGGQLAIGNRHRVMQQDKATTAPKSDGTDLGSLLYALWYVFFGLFIFLFCRDGACDDDGPYLQ